MDLGTVDDPACVEALERFEASRLSVAVWDTTTDVGIPAFLCSIVDRVTSPLRRLYASSGSGCHPDRGIALFRALSEAAQSRLTLIAGSRDDNLREKYQRLRDPERLKLHARQIEIEKPVCSFRDVPTLLAPNLDQDVMWELDRIRQAGLHTVIIVDLTRLEFKIPVVRVIIPGLEASPETSEYVPGPRAQKAASAA
jgi:ribosomal protein S12 methylthiotransferase accessory factor